MSHTPEFRRDPVTGRTAIVAPERSLRPFVLPGTQPYHRTTGERNPCPFCEGQEHDTPHEVLAHRTPGSLPDGPGWQLRVVPNKYPAVRPTADAVELTVMDGVRTAPAFGLHEVVIETARHETDPAELTDAEFAAVLRAYRDRLVMLADDGRLRYAQVFKNVGSEAGASLGHTHSQIVALPLVPDAVREEQAGAAVYHAAHGRCPYCDAIAADRVDGRRVVAETDRFVAVAAFAPRFAYEVRVFPTAHASRYEGLTDADAVELAGLMKGVLTAVDAVLGRPAYNWYLHTAPLRDAESPHVHWHFVVLPRTSRVAGFEWGTGCFIVAVPPERAAADLRAALVRRG